jgi:hypothetical protein
MRLKSAGRNETKPTMPCNAQTPRKHALDDRGGCDPNEKPGFRGYQ